MKNWLRVFQYNPLSYLNTSKNKAISLFCKRDLMDEEIKLEILWDLPQVIKLIKKQNKDGSWKYPNSKPRIENYYLLETYRNLGILVEKYGLNKNHQAIKKAADYLFSCQTSEGDFRGIYGNQYSPNYSAAIMELLIKSGYENDPIIHKGFTWLLSIRQNDGGWASPIRTVNAKYLEVINNPPIKPDSSKIYSHLFTGIILRAFAAHPYYRKSKEALVAGNLLKNRFFKPDKYVDRRGKEYWTKFSFPFWFTDLLSALDSLSLMQFSNKDKEIKSALDWFINKQNENGSWELKLLKGKDKDLNYWICLVICRIFKRFFS